MRFTASSWHNRNVHNQLSDMLFHWHSTKLAWIVCIGPKTLSIIILLLILHFGGSQVTKDQLSDLRQAHVVSETFKNQTTYCECTGNRLSTDFALSVVHHVLPTHKENCIQFLVKIVYMGSAGLHAFHRCPDQGPGADWHVVMSMLHLAEESELTQSPATCNRCQQASTVTSMQRNAWCRQQFVVPTQEVLQGQTRKDEIGNGHHAGQLRVETHGMPLYRALDQRTSA